MGATFAVIAELFGGEALAGAALETAAAGTIVDAATGLTLSSGLSGAGLAGGAAAAAGVAGGASLIGTLGTGALSAGVSSAVGALLQPKKPGVTNAASAPTPTMPDPIAQQQAKSRSLVEQLSRRGRAASILTDTADKLGG